MTLLAQFATIPLPYTYVNIPQADEPPNRPRTRLRYYVNKVITRLTREVFLHSGFACTQDFRCWNASWGRQFDFDEYSCCDCWQKVNHWAGAFLMGRKDNLHERMTELQRRVGEFASFYPKSFLVPQDSAALALEWKTIPTWIIKPSASSRGRGIHLLDSANSSPPASPGLVQLYIRNPLLITNRKFDVRLYALVSSITPLRIYLHHSGLARFCTHEYSANGSCDDLMMHLTNFSLNKTDKGFIRCSGNKESVNDSKWTLDFLISHLKDMGIDTVSLMAEFERITIATIISGMCAIKPNHAKVIPHRHTSYEMYGIDIMIDSDLRCHLIEINISPSLSGLDSQLDHDMKFPLNLDLLRMARIVECDAASDDPCPAIEILDEYYTNSLHQERRAQIESGSANPWDTPVFGDFVIVRDFLEEKSLKTGFRLVYPTVDRIELFKPCFDKICYEDLVFNAWIAMDEAEQLAVIQKHWKIYSRKMARLARELSGV
jgi:tubulin polyglutamylase TTLL4